MKIEDATIYLSEGYINAIYPLSSSACVCGNTQSHRSGSRLRPVPPLILASTRRLLLFEPPMYVRERQGVYPTHPRRVSVEGAVSISVPKSADLQAKPYPDSGFLSQAVSASCGSEASRPSSQHASQP